MFLTFGVYVPDWWVILRNEFSFWNVPLGLHVNVSIHDSMNIPKIEFIAYIFTFYYNYLKYKTYF